MHLLFTSRGDDAATAAEDVAIKAPTADPNAAALN